MRKQNISFLVLVLAFNVFFMGCSASSSDTSLPSSTESTAADDSEYSGTSTAGAPTDEEIANGLSAVSDILSAVPWQDIDWSGYIDQASQTDAAELTQAIVLEPILISSTDGMNIYMTFVKNSDGLYVVQLNCTLNGFPMQDTQLLTGATVSGTLYVQVGFENIYELTLGVHVFTQSGSPLAISGKTLGLISTTTTIGITDFYVGYDLWNLAFLDDPAPSGTIVINGALPITMTSQWTSFILNLLNA
jgi:hypothetical protein